MEGAPPRENLADKSIYMERLPLRRLSCNSNEPSTLFDCANSELLASDHTASIPREHFAIYCRPHNAALGCKS